MESFRLNTRSKILVSDRILKECVHQVAETFPSPITRRAKVLSPPCEGGKMVPRRPGPGKTAQRNRQERAARARPTSQYPRAALSARRRRWRARVRATQSEDELLAVRASIRSGRPFGNTSWTEGVAQRLRINLNPLPRGRPSKEKRTDPNFNDPNFNSRTFESKKSVWLPRNSWSDPRRRPRRLSGRPGPSRRRGGLPVLGPVGAEEKVTAVRREVQWEDPVLSGLGLHPCGPAVFPSPHRVESLPISRLDAREVATLRLG
jgi:hypothetical protein